MRPDKLTGKFQQALAEAQSLALGRDHQFLEPVHVMLAMLDQQGGTAVNLLTAAGIDIHRLRQELDNTLGTLPQVQGNAGEIHISRDLDRLLNLTDKYAQQRGDQYISSELFLLAALEDKGSLGKALKSQGLDMRLTGVEPAQVVKGILA